MAGSGKRYAAVLDSLMAAPDCDAVLAVVGSSAQFHPDVAVEPILRTTPGAKPLAAFLTPQADQSLTLLAQQGIAAFRTPEACADALATFFRWRAPRNTGIGATLPAGVKLPSGAAADEADALALFAALGVPVAASATAAAPDFAHGVPYPVAAKVRSPDIAHKTEAGGVLLNIANAAEFAQRVPAMLAAVALAQPQAKIAGVLVQHMEKGLAEVIVGYRHDPMVGPVVMVGAGGTLAEIYKDYALRIAPVSEAEALEMINGVRGLATIRGYRNLPRGDVAALARAVAAFSQLALLPGLPVQEAEINPLLVKDAGVVAVDGLIVLGQEMEFAK
jgi:acyl-CoA synthetase (NDP forming)